MATYYVATTGNDTTGNGSSGNPYATPGKASGVATTSGDLIYVKSGTYTTTTTTANVAGGKVSLSEGVRMEGYQTTIGDLAARPVLKAHTTGFTLFDMAGSTNRMAALVNLEADANGNGTITGFADSSSYGATTHRCVARSCATGFSGAGKGGSHRYNAAYSCTTGFSVSGGGLLMACFAKSCTTGFASDIQSRVIGCVASGGTSGFTNSTYQASWDHCVAYGTSGSGFALTGFQNLMALANCAAVSCGGYGISGGSGVAGLYHFASYNNTSGRVQTTPAYEIGGVTLSGDPFTNASGDDFTLNSTAGAGAALKGVGLPQVFPLA